MHLQSPLDENSGELTTINTLLGLFRYEFPPLRLIIPLAISQKDINQIITGLERVELHQDDIAFHVEHVKLHHERYIKVI